MCLCVCPCAAHQHPCHFYNLAKILREPSAATELSHCLHPHLYPAAFCLLKCTCQKWLLFMELRHHTMIQKARLSNTLHIIQGNNQVFICTRKYLVLTCKGKGNDPGGSSFIYNNKISKGKCCIHIFILSVGHKNISLSVE